MNRLLLRVLAAVLLSSPLSARAGDAPRVGECLSGSLVQEVLAQGRVKRLAEIRRGLSGEIVRADLCRASGILVYRITLLEGGGRVRRLLLDASSGRMVYDAAGN